MHQSNANNLINKKNSNKPQEMGSGKEAKGWAHRSRHYSRHGKAKRPKSHGKEKRLAKAAHGKKAVGLVKFWEG